MQGIGVKLIAFVVLLFASTITMANDAPRLVLQITVDGFRGDLLQRYEKHFGKNGFRYLLNKGVYYSNTGC